MDVKHILRYKEHALDNFCFEDFKNYVHMSVQQNTKIKLVIFLTKKIKNLLPSSDDCDPILSKLMNLLDKIIVVIHKIDTASIEQANDVRFRLAIIHRLFLILRRLYRDSVFYTRWKMYTNICGNYPEMNEDDLKLINKSLDI